MHWNLLEEIKNWSNLKNVISFKNWYYYGTLNFDDTLDSNTDKFRMIRHSYALIDNSNGFEGIILTLLTILLTVKLWETIVFSPSHSIISNLRISDISDNNLLISTMPKNNFLNSTEVDTDTNDWTAW